MPMHWQFLIISTFSKITFTNWLECHSNENSNTLVLFIDFFAHEAQIKSVIKVWTTILNKPGVHCASKLLQRVNPK